MFFHYLCEIVPPQCSDYKKLLQIVTTFTQFKVKTVSEAFHLTLCPVFIISCV